MKEEGAVSRGPRPKKRKSMPAFRPDTAAPDIWALEEDEVDSRNPDKDLQLYKQSCGNIRRLMREILEYKRRGKFSPDVSERKVQTSMLFVTLKKLNRFEKIRNRKARETANEAKLKVDTHHLQLQNLLYEVSHLTKEVNKCLEFKSKDEDIELVPVEEFYKEAPSQISRPEKSKHDLHAQTLARLDWELEQRKRLALKCKEAETSKDSISQDIKNKKEYLETLAPCLNNILQATIPVQEQLGFGNQVKRPQNKLASLLPVPLFILYVQITAYAEAWGEKMSAVIEGDVDEAKALNEVADERDEDSGDSDQEESQGNKRYRRSSVNRMTEMRKKILKKHPLLVSVTFRTEDGHKLELRFSYATLLHVVTVVPVLPFSAEFPTPSRDVLSPSIFLSCLFPADSGQDTPNQANHFQLKRLGMDDFKSYINELGYPYEWAQRVAGLDYTHSTSKTRSEERTVVPSSAVSSSHMERIVRAIKDRLISRIALQKQLHNLEHNIVPIDAKTLSFFPAKIVTRLTAFASLPWEDFLGLPQAKRLVNDGLVDISYFTFSLVMERGSAKLVALAAISPDYPKQHPLFILNTSWKEGRSSMEDAALWDLEKEVNLYWEELLECAPASLLLSCQVQRLLMCFDVYLETETAIEVVEGPQEFAKEKLFLEHSRGRNRTKPYKYNPAMGLFAHR